MYIGAVTLFAFFNSSEDRDIFSQAEANPSG